MGEIFMIQRPNKNEYNPYYEKYISLIPNGDILAFLKMQHEDLQSLLRDVSNEQGEYRYAPGKWSLKEVIGHMIDTERIMSYRLLAVSRGETMALPSFDQDEYVKGADFDLFPLADLLTDFALVRACTCSLLGGLSDDVLARTGMVADYPTTARALAYIIAGHELHHLSIIKERYL